MCKVKKKNRDKLEVRVQNKSNNAIGPNIIIIIILNLIKI